MQDLMPPINTPDSAFHDGDPTTGQLGTIVTALWLNNVQSATRDVQLEIKNVLAKAGIQPDPKKTNQLAEAISQIIGSGNYASTAYVDNGLNKKIDKANISSVLGNDNNKVPSLGLITTELGKKQPKGDYAPAGDYATTQQLRDGLDKKFDKIGGSISGNVTAEGDVASKFNSYIVKLETRGGKTGIVSSTDNQRYYTHILQEKSGTLMHLGDGGWMSDTGAVFGGISLLSDYRLNSIGYAYSASQTDTYQKTNHHFLNVFGYVNRNYGVQLAFTNNGRVGFRNIENNTAKEWADFYTTINTTIDRNGCLKVAGTSNELSDFPVGSPIPWPQATAPTGFLVCNGQTFNK
ncbi:phage tail protein, partial [Providencia rettgeri]|uniref:phage tail protein n=1 Tax=Providencia rettgeri TaxID=587 RepID=UPI0025728415